MNDIRLSFPGGKRVEATMGGHHIVTDQTLAHGGDDSAPEPFELFLASLATCAGLYVVAFCQTRGISTEGLELVQRHVLNDGGLLTDVSMEIHLPREFPEKYRAAVVRAAEGCKVRRTLANPPNVTVKASAAPASDEADEAAIV